MKYTFHETTDPKEFDDFVIDSDQNTLFQCSPWAALKDNWDHALTCVREDGKIVAAALVLIRRLLPGRTLVYIPRGPVMDYNNTDLVSFYLGELKKFAKKHHACAVRFDPAVLSRKYSYKERKDPPARGNEHIIQKLQFFGAKHRGYTVMIEEATQPRFNAEMDVEPGYRKMLEHKTQKCIRTSERKGIEVLEGPEYIHMFAEAMHYTEVRKGVVLRNEAYFRHMMEIYGDEAACMVAVLNFPKQLKRLDASIAENTKLLESENLSKKKRAEAERLLAQDQKEKEQLQADYEREGKDQVITCGILAVRNRGMMELFYMGNNPDYLRMYSSYLLYAKCLDICENLGIRRCSFGGIEGTLDDGLTLFKSNFLMNVEEYIGEFNIVLDPVTYGLFDSIYPKVLQAAARIRSGKKKQ